jgi:MFS family permease
MGIVQVAVPAFAADRGSAAAGGLLLAALSSGSLAGGLVYGAHLAGPPPARLAALMLGLGATFALLALAGTPPVLAVLLALSGLLVAPTTSSARRCWTPSRRPARSPRRSPRW